MKHSLFVGRWQPFHKGHKVLVESVLKKKKPVVIAIRNTEVSRNNPFTVDQRWEMIRKELSKYNSLVKIVVIPDIDEICYGRHVGYRVRQIELDGGVEKISGTKNRKIGPEIVWLTGNVGAGKTTLANLLAERLDGIVLDGNEMRRSISVGIGFSKEDREEHNLRVARLAKVLHRQHKNVIVSVIAPFKSTRKKIDRIIKPKWIYIKRRELEPDPERPYEEPERPFLVVDTDKNDIGQSVNLIWEALHKDNHRKRKK
jgi:cytidyltransferase-like protein